ncbi:MAG: AI-2E family transporter [Actinomycetota bacterium]|nr:AI-2E family transporter [Actinomycetota bacterium]
MTVRGEGSREPAAGPRRTVRFRSVPESMQAIAAFSLCFLAIVAGIVLLAYVLVYLRLIVLPVIVALFLTTVLAPFVERLCRAGWKRARATAAVFITALVLFVVLISVLAPQVGSEVGEMSSAIKGGADQALVYLTGAPLNLSQDQIDSFVDRASDQLAQNREEIASGVITGAVKVGEFITGTLLAAFLLFFFLKDGPSMWAWFTGQFDQPAREHLNNVGHRVLSTMGAYLRGIALVGLIEGTAIGIVLAILGVPLLVPLVLLQFFAAFFPVVGALLAGTIAVLVALVSGGFTNALIVGVAILIIQQADNHLLQPLIMGRAVKLHPIAVILALAAGGIAGGIIGALLAVPMAAVASGVGNYVNGLRDHNTPSFSELQNEGSDSQGATPGA